MKYARIYARVMDAIWASTPQTPFSILEFLEGYEKPEARSGESSEKKPLPLYSVYNGVGVHNISGIIGKNLASMDIACGGYDVNTLADALVALHDDPSVKEIILNIDSPGGVVTGVPEAADMVAASQKPIVSYTDSQAASAAYWIGSQASAFFASRSSDVGSIGVYSLHLDRSRMMANMGLNVNVFRSGSEKAAGVAGTPLTEKQKAAIQASVEEIGVDFRSAVSTKRKSVNKDSMEGQVYSGSNAMSAGLIDGIAPSLGAVISRLIESRR